MLDDHDRLAPLSFYYTVDHWELLGEDWLENVERAAHWCYVNLDRNSWLHSPRCFEFKNQEDYTWFRLTWT